MFILSEISIFVPFSLKYNNNFMTTEIPCSFIIYIKCIWNGYCGKGKRMALLFSIFAVMLLSSCNDSIHYATPEERRTTDSIVKAIPTEDSLNEMRRHFDSEGNQLGSITVLRELGKRQRNESRFDDALKSHSEGLRLAEIAKDTLETVQALNNIGTNYRRLGIYDVATSYHYRALRLNEEAADNTVICKKNRMVSLNGLGNIYMATGNYERADSVLRLALAGEQQLGSSLGMAINYANIGSIFKQKNNIDSAWFYYRRSMACNEEAHSVLGVSLCHTYFGSLYEKEKKYDKAIEEYNKAFLLMQASKDEWHSLGSLLALAHIYIEMGDYAEAIGRLEKAEEVARRIKSKEHLAEIRQQYYLIYKHQGDWRRALDNYVTASEIQDSLVDIKKLNQIQNISLGIERNRQAIEMSDARQRYESERTTRRVSIAVFSVILILLAGVLAMMFYILRTRARNHRMLKQLSELRETFFTNITHEFRTPLTLILGMSHDIGNNESLPEKTREMGLVMERQGNSLLTLINQLLDISKVKSAVGEPDWRHGDIALYISMIVDAHREHASRKNINLQFFSDGSVEMDFVPDFVNKALNNLLANSMKFTPEGGKVSVRVEKADAEQVRISVSDNGVGIKPESLEHIFKPFYQEEGESRLLGTGVGLALVKQIVSSVKGEIRVESTVGRGTKFIIDVPIKHGDGKWTMLEKTDSVNVVPEVGDDGVKPEDTMCSNDDSTRILIIEDNRDVARYIGSRLSSIYDICYAFNGREGIEKARDVMPDLIITDLMMPEMNGLEVCRQVRNDEIISHVPIIVITAKVSEAERIEGLEAGADAYLCKPFNDTELRVRVEKLLEQRQHLREKFSQLLSEGKESEVELCDADRRFLAKMVDVVYLLMDKRQADVNTLAEKLCMSSRQLHRKIQALTGETPAAYILQIKMKKAKILLDTKPEMSLEEISDRCSFEHYSGFYHAFKKLHGITPKQYKRRVEDV